MDEILDTEQAAAILKNSPSTLEGWRSNNTGPKFYKPAGKVVYLKEDLIEWIKTGAKNEV